MIPKFPQSGNGGSFGGFHFLDPLGVWKIPSRQSRYSGVSSLVWTLGALGFRASVWPPPSKDCVRELLSLIRLEHRVPLGRFV